MNEDIAKSLNKFLDLFEIVFDRDWTYSKDMMGIIEETDEQQKNVVNMGLKTIVIISSEGTFLRSEVKDETENWGNRGKLLREYRHLKKLLNR